MKSTKKKWLSVCLSLLLVIGLIPAGMGVMAVENDKTLVVAADGTGNFTTIQSAIDAIATESDPIEP